jgi:cytochrome P450
MATAWEESGRKGAAEAPLFNPLDPAFVADPYPTYARLRDEAPLHFVPPMDAWVISRYADVQFALRDARFGRTGFESILLQKLGPGPLQRSFSRWMLFKDPPDHTRLRNLVTRAFTPRAIERLRAGIQAAVDQTLDRLEPAGQADLIGNLAYPLPVTVICDLLGVPADDHEDFKRWSDGLARGLDLVSTTPAIVAEGNDAAQRLAEYFGTLIAEHRAQPRDDLLSLLIAAEEDGDRLTEDELLATCVMLYFAGHETTVNLIGNGTLALLQHPAELTRLRQDPSLIQTAVEEFLRYDGSVQRTARITLDEVPLAGDRLPAGSLVYMLLGAANRDLARFPEPDRLDVGRSDNPHLTFGGGIHYCVGAALARLEAQIAVNALVKRFPGLALATDQLVWRPNATLRGLQALPVVW